MKFAFPFVTVAALGVLFVTAAEPAKSGKPVRGAPIQALPPATPTNAATKRKTSIGNKRPCVISESKPN